MKIGDDARETVFVSRQPILDPTGKVFGYELLYRHAAEAHAGEDSGESAGARALTDVVLNLGLDSLAEGHPAFLHFSRDLLLGEAGTLLPADKVVLQVSEGLLVDDELVEAGKQLNTKGYKLALNGFVAGSSVERLVPYAKFLKIDVTTTDSPAHAALIKRFSTGAVRLIASKVESADAFKAAHTAGYRLFQGQYFCKPVTCKAGALPARRLAYLQLLAALRQPHVGVREIEELVKHDVSLSYRVLRCVNSAAFGLRSEVTSIRQALIMLGLDPIRKWVSVWSVAGLNTGGTSELVSVSVLRARCCELLGEKVHGKTAESELFLLGLCSLLDAILDRPLTDSVAELPLSAEIKDALLGQPNFARSVLDIVIAYESGLWDEATTKARSLGLPDDAPAKVYAEALEWAREVSRAAAA